MVTEDGWSVKEYGEIGLIDDDAPAPGPGPAIAAAAVNVRRLRRQRGWSLADAAKAADIGKSTLAQLESGSANPSLETLWAVARAFGVPVGSLIGSVHGGSRLVSERDRVSVHSASHPYQIQMLLSLGPLRGTDLSLLMTEPGPPRESAPHLAGSVEHVFVINGRLRISPGDGSAVEMREGDLLSFPSDVSHSYETLTKGTRSLIIMEYR